MILNTVAVNLKDCPPFASLHSSDPAENDDAEAQFHLGQSALRLNAPDSAAEARSDFQKACDCDALPFRADSTINSIIRQTGMQMGGPDLVVCDAAASLPEPGKISGQETFYEHVHFNFDGNYKLAMLWAVQAERLLPGDGKTKAIGGWASQQVCEARLGLTDWNRGIVFRGVRQRMERPPLNSQFNNPQRMSDLAGRMDVLSKQQDAAAATYARALYTDAIANFWN
jgi:hypothetical protein